MKWVLRQALVIDGLGRVRERASLLIEGGRIAAVGPDHQVRRPKGATEVGASGFTVLPGLIDCHVHLGFGAEPDVVRTLREEPAGLTLLKASRYARLTLEAGFTTVRDLGYRDHSIFALTQAIAADLLPGPRILAVGVPICMTGGHLCFMARQADGPAEVVAAVREQMGAGAEVIKFIASGGILTPGTSPDRAQMAPEELAAGTAEACRAGRRVAAHAHSADGMKNAIRAGAHSIEHGTLMDEEAAGLMRERDVFLVPTLSALATTAEHGSVCGVPVAAVGKATAIRARHEASFRLAHRTGVPIALGTDAGTPANHHGENAQELERMVALGMTPMEAIVAATGAAARLLGLAEELGSIEPGKVADLLLVKGDPLKRIGLLRDKSRLVGVMQGGRFVAGTLAARS